MKELLTAPLGIVFALGSPITFIINVVDTWQGQASVLGKLLISLTLDAFLAAIWPVTWLIWIVMHLMGHGTSLSRVLGF